MNSQCTVSIKRRTGVINPVVSNQGKNFISPANEQIFKYQTNHNMHRESYMKFEPNLENQTKVMADFQSLRVDYTQWSGKGLLYEYPTILLSNLFTSTFKLGCQARIRLCANKSKSGLVITAVQLVHSNHPNIDCEKGKCWYRYCIIQIEDTTF